MVPVGMRNFSPVDYADRLKKALQADSISSMELRSRVRGLAKALDISVQAVDKLLKGGSNSMSAYNNAKTAQHLRVDAHWLATGEGEMHPKADAREAELLRNFRMLTGAMQDSLLTVSDNFVTASIPHLVEALPSPQTGVETSAFAQKPRRKTKDYM